MGKLVEKKATAEASFSHFFLFWKNRPDLLKVLRELLLERICLPEQEVSGEHLEAETEKTLKQMAVQLRGELRQFIQANSFSKPRDELKWPRGGQLVQVEEPSRVKLKDASVQTTATERDSLRFKHEGTREAWEETLPAAAFSTVYQPESLCATAGRPACPLSLPRGADKVSLSLHYLFHTKRTHKIARVCLKLNIHKTWCPPLPALILASV